METEIVLGLPKGLSQNSDSPHLAQVENITEERKILTDMYFCQRRKDVFIMRERKNKLSLKFITLLGKKLRFSIHQKKS